MAKRVRASVIGAFVLVGLILTLAAVVLWGSGRLFERRFRFVCFFPGSVNGLNVGSAVKYRGVPIGKVVAMRVRYQQPFGDPRIPVFIELNGNRLRELGADGEPSPTLMRSLVERGLRARLETESLVTGQLYVNLDLYPPSPYQLVRPGGAIAEIPTLPTTLEEATKSLSALLTQMREADLGGIARSLAATVDGLARIVNTPAIGKTLAELPATVASFRQLARGVDRNFEKLSTGLQATVDARGPLVADVQQTLTDLQKAAEAVRSLAEFLERNPNALITGRKRP